MKNSISNDYAVAKKLNESVESIFSVISLYQIIGPLKEFKPEELNRAYLFLVNELETLYGRNPKLASVKPEPTWRRFEIIKNKLYEIQKYLEDNNDGQEHILHLEKLCILSGLEDPKLTIKQKKYVYNAETLVDRYMKIAIEAIKKLPVDNTQEELEKDPRNLRFWCIQEYSVLYKPDGTILINNALKLKKIHAGSTAERLLEQCVKNPNKLFKPDIGQTARNISTVISSAGFNPALRDIFFPIVSEDKGVIFRPTVTRSEAIKEKLDTYEIDTLLANAGAEIAVRPGEELVAIGLAAPDDDV